MSGRKRIDPSVTTTDIAGSKEIQGLFLNMIASQLAKKTQQRGKQIQKPMNTQSKPYELAAKWVGNYLFENGMTKTLSTASFETGNVIKTIGLPTPITEEFKFKSNRPLFRQLVSNLRPNLDKPRPLPKPASTTVAGTEVATTAAAPVKSRGLTSKRHRDEDAEVSKHHHHHHHSKRPSGRHHHRHHETEDNTYDTRKDRKHRSSRHHHHHRRQEPTYSESYVSTATYGAVKSRDLPKTKPVNERPRAPGKLTFKERVARLLMKSNLAVEKSQEFEFISGSMDVSPYYPADGQHPFQPPTAKSATSRTGLPSDQYYEEEEDYYYDSSSGEKSYKSRSKKKTSTKRTSTHTDSESDSDADSTRKSTTKKTSTKRSSTKRTSTHIETESGSEAESTKKSTTKKSTTKKTSTKKTSTADESEPESDSEAESTKKSTTKKSTTKKTSTKKSSTKKTSSSDSESSEGASASDPEAEEDHEEEEDGHHHEEEEEEEEEEDHGEEEGEEE